MKIAWFTDTWLPTRDGVVTSLLAFKKEIEKKGNEVYIFAPGKENCENDNVFYYKSRPFKKYENYRFVSFPSFFSKRTERIIEKIKPGIIHSHSPGFMGVHALIASYKKEIPLFFTYHTFIDDSAYLIIRDKNFQNFAKKLLYQWLRYYMKRCSCIIAPSNYTARYINEKIIEKNIEVIPTGIDLKRFETKKNRSGIKKEDGNKIILHVGRIVKEKNIDLIIESAPYILKKIDAIFLIVGEGPARKEYEEKVKEKGLQNSFIFTGFVDDEKLLHYYASSDVFVFPSIYETQGIVALEAMASGLPVVAARAKALPDFIRDGENGYLFDPQNVKEFAEKVIKAIEDKKIAERGMEYVKNFSIEKMAEKLVSLYESKMRA
ncbi:MAG: glycosyltransferase [Thermoplasmatales archaeon]|nr:glycosyltransferase [Thermoplasmatales archaeon]